MIIKKLLRKKREERYQSATDLLNDLAALKQELALSNHFADDENGTTSLAAFESSSLARARASTNEVPANSTSSAEFIVSEIKRHRGGSLAVLLILIAAVVDAGVWTHHLLNLRQAAAASLPWQKVTLRRFATEGGVPFRVAISPNGKSLVYRQRINGNDSLWLGNVDSNSNVSMRQSRSSLKARKIEKFINSPGPSMERIWFIAVACACRK